MKILDLIISIITAPYNFILNSKLGRLNLNPYTKAIFIFLVAILITAIIMALVYLPIILN